MLKLRKLRDGDEWKGKVSYQDQEIEMSDASEVEEEIRKGKHPCPLSSPIWRSDELCEVVGVGLALIPLPLFWAWPLRTSPSPCSIPHPPSLHPSSPPRPPLPTCTSDPGCLHSLFSHQDQCFWAESDLDHLLLSIYVSENDANFKIESLSPSIKHLFPIRGHPYPDGRGIGGVGVGVAGAFPPEAEWMCLHNPCFG